MTKRSVNPVANLCETMSSKPVIEYRSTSDYIRRLIEVFGNTAEKKQRLLEDTGISAAQLTGRKSAISPKSQRTLFANITKEIGQDWVFRYAGSIPTEIRDHLRKAMLSAPNLADSLDMLTKFNHTREPTFYFEQYKINEKRYLHFDLVFGSTRETRSILEAISIGLNRFLQSIWNPDWRGLEVWFPFEKPKYAQLIQNLYVCPVKYNQKRFGIVINEDICQIPSATYDPKAYNQAVLNLYKSTGLAGVANEFVLSVKNHLGAITNHRPNAEETADALRVSKRTLNRRLTMAGTSYRTLLDQSLKVRAEKLLTETRLSRSEIADRLGYADQTSFSRALKRWKDQDA